MKNEKKVKYRYYDKIHNDYVDLTITCEMKKEIDKLNNDERNSNKKYSRNTISLELIMEEVPELLPADEFNNPEKILLNKHFEILNSILKEQKRTIVENALFKLTDKQREVVEMIFYKNMSYSQIANEINISKSVVGKRLDNAIKNIRNYIIRTQN